MISLTLHSNQAKVSPSSHPFREICMKTALIIITVSVGVAPTGGGG